ncbi:MAG: aminotransferase class I/II-fold pyridoxal phosphate-dependent enzyme [Actinomycetota bacterium]
MSDLAAPSSTDLAAAVEGRTAEEIASSIARHIRQVPLPAGTPLPTVRSLATELGVSASTVSDSWRILRSRGVIHTDRRRGTTVRPDRAGTGERAWHVPVEPGALAVDLSTGTPDPALLPDLGDALLQATDQHQVTSYLDRPVIPALEVELRRRWPFDAGRITLLDGAQDALDRLIDTTVAYGDRVIVENPTFPPILDMLELAGADVIGVPVDDEGPDVDAVVAALAHEPTVAIFQPRAHNPTGVAISEARAARLAELLAEAGVLVIEDDHSGMVAGAPLHSLGVHRPDSTVHVHSFSKSHGPDLRLAAVGGPVEIIDAMVRRRQLGPSWTSRLLQRVLLGLLTDPAADASVEQAESAYLRRRNAFVDELRSAGVEVDAGRSGLNVWVPVDDERDAVVALAAAGIGAAPGEPFVVGRADDAHIRLTISRVDDPRVAAHAVARAARRGGGTAGR